MASGSRINAEMDTATGFEFLESIVKLIKSQHVLAPSNEVVVIDFLKPDRLKRMMNFDVKKTVSDVRELEALCRSVIKYSVQTNSTKFYNQMYGGTDIFGLAGSWLAETLHTHMQTYEIAPVFTLIEQIMLDELKDLLGYPKIGDGIFTQGGSESNMYALAIARYRLFPQIKTDGFYRLAPLVVFTSEDGHNSILKAANWLGFGLDYVIKIKTDCFGRMCAVHLEEEIVKCKERYIPLFVNVTLGTTALGAFDPISKIAILCENHKIWLHVDACYGGSLLLAKQYNHKFELINKSDSFAWNPHKMLGAPLHCSLLITKYCDLFAQTSCPWNIFFNPEERFYSISYDLGNKCIEKERRVDAFKLWVMWKARGRIGFETLITEAMNNANYFCNKLRGRDDFRLVQNVFDSSTVCFWYIPKRLRNPNPPDNPKWWKELDKIAPAIKEEMMKDGRFMISYLRLNSRPEARFFRLVVTCHPKRTPADFDNLIKEFELYENF